MPVKEKELKPAKPPKTIGACADQVFKLRAEISATKKRHEEELAQKTLDLKSLEEHLINTLPKSDSSGAVGKLARVTVVISSVPQVQDWDALYKHIKKTGEFDLLTRGLSKEAIRARWENNKKVPGIGTFDVVKLSVNKL